MNKTFWYAAKCIFLHRAKKRGPRQLYEERIILVRACSFAEAIERAEKEAAEYCVDNCQHVGDIEVFQLFEQKVKDGTEVFSSMRQSNLKPQKYLAHFYPQIPDDCETVGEKHRWYNLDDVHSGCYRCKVVREGRLWKEKKLQKDDDDFAGLLTTVTRPLVQDISGCARRCPTRL